MGLHDRLKTNRERRRRAEATVTRIETAAREAQHETRASTRTPSSRPGSTTRASPSSAPSSSSASDEDLTDRVPRAVTEQLALDRTPLTRDERRADRPRDHRRHPRLRPARAVPPRRLRHRGHGQRARPDLRRARGQDRADRSGVRRQRAPPAHHRQDRLAGRPPRRRVVADGRRPPPGRLAASTRSSRRSRCAGPTLTIRKFARDPYTMNDLIKFGTVTAEGGAVPRRLRAGEAEHPHLRRYRYR